MGTDMALVPGNQDCFDVGEVLVQGRTSDAGFLGYLRHRHRQQAMLRHQCRGRVQDRVAHFPPVRRNRLSPQLRHGLSIHFDAHYTYWQLTDIMCRKIGTDHVRDDHADKETHIWLTRTHTLPPATTLIKGTV